MPCLPRPIEELLTAYSAGLALLRESVRGLTSVRFQLEKTRTRASKLRSSTGC